MQIKNMSYIIALAEAGTLSAAGKQLGISQPTLSVFLSNLEQELGIDLFLRDKKKLIPTPAGRIYLEAARRILATQEQTLQSIRQLTAAPPYARRLYYHPEYNFQTKENPNAKGMWYEDWMPGGQKADFAPKAFKQFYKKAGGV